MEFLPLIFIFVLMYVLLVLPQQRRAREESKLLASLEEGDEVVLKSGIHGFISSMDDEVIWLEVASGVELKVTKMMVAHRLTEPEDSDDDAGGGLGDTDVIGADD
jgi:preprotein translocase subunit YajC